MLLKLMIITALLSFQNVHAYGFTYDGNGVTTDRPYVQMRDHICLAFMMFLEARGDGEASQMFHGMATIQRVLNPRRWGSDVCSVITQPSQYESIKRPEREAIQRVLAGDLDAIDEFIITNYTSRFDRDVWYQINFIAYELITAVDTEGWIDADHFYAPESLRRRSLPIPGWIQAKEVVIVAGNTYFLR